MVQDQNQEEAPVTVARGMTGINRPAGAAVRARAGEAAEEKAAVGGTVRDDVTAGSA